MGLPRTVVRPAAALDHLGRAAGLITLEPGVSGLATDLKLAAQIRHGVLFTAGRHHKPQALLGHTRLSPSHPDRPPVLLAQVSRMSCLNVSSMSCQWTLQACPTMTLQWGAMKTIFLLLPMML